ncbi:MAG: hypothetical protein HQK95_07135 [Nitrospirae bacterium]|nr:hypothetical protein [Nitrospirota bacterium]
MEFGTIFIEGIHAIKRNLVVITPTIIASLVMLIATSVFMGGDLASLDESNPDKAIMAIRAVAPRLFVISALNYFLQVFSHCATVAMAIDIVNKGTCNVFDGYLAVLRNIGRIVPASLLILIFLTFGLMLLILPALIISFVFILTFVIIMNEDIAPVMAMKKSYHTMKGNYGSSIVLFLFLLAVGITVSIINILLGQMLYVGVVLSLFLSGVFMSFAAITLLKFYTILETRQQVLSLHD